MRIPDKQQHFEMIEKLKKCVEFYEKTKFKKHRMKLYLSNGEIIEFMFKESSIAHLLGVKTLTLKHDRLLDSTLQIDMLKEIIAKKASIYEKCEYHHINYFDVFSEFINEKIDAFETVLRFNMSNILFACKYDRANSFVNGEIDNFGCDYYIAMETDELKYIFLGLKKSAEEKYYAPASIICTQDESYLKKLIQNQQIMLVNTLCLDDINRSTSLKNYEKMGLLQRLISISEQCNSHLIVGRTLQYDLKKVMIDKDKLEIYGKFIFELTKCISSGRIFDINRQQLDDNLIELAEAYNLSLKSGKCSSSSKKISELKNLKEQLESLNKSYQNQQEEIIELKRQILEQSLLIEKQETELEPLRNFKNETLQLVKRYDKANGKD